MNKIQFVVLAAVVCTAQFSRAATNTVTNTGTSGFNSLRQAIIDANNNPGPDVIIFAIPGPGPHTIKPTTGLGALPLITDTVTIDGYTQSGSSTNNASVGNNAVLMIELDGSLAGTRTTGLVVRASNTLIRGLAINGFAGNGITIDFGISGVIIDGNFIGPDVDGVTLIGNGFTDPEAHQGMEIDGIDSIVRYNIIAGNCENGIFVWNTAVGNRIIRNSIHSNSQCDTKHDGISLFDSNFTGNMIPNDPCDGDEGGNQQQNHPELATSTCNGLNTTITGLLDSTALQIFTIEFFYNDECNATGFGEGKVYFGSTNVMTGLNCTNNFTVTFPVVVPDRKFVTATATDVNGNTSEFSACVPNSLQINPPRANDDTYATAAATLLNVNATSGVLSNDFDVDGDPLTAIIATNPAHAASFALNPDGSFNYTPTNGFSGIDRFNYRANDGVSSSGVANVDIIVSATTPTGDGVSQTFDASPYGANPVTLTFSNVTAGGVTSITPIDPTTAGTVPGSFYLLPGLSFDIDTTATFNGPIDLCFTLPGINSNVFAALSFFHNEGGVLVDRTTTRNALTQTICAQVTNVSPFALAVFQSVPHDLIVTAIKAPKKITLKTGTTPKPGKLSVSIQNLGAATEVISNSTVLAQVVQLEIESLDTCAAPTATLVPPKKGFPLLLAPKKKLTLAYTVNITCANDNASGAGHEDYRYTVVLDRSALDGFPDTNASNDDCPRTPSGSDKGCGGKDPATKQLGADILTDVVVK